MLKMFILLQDEVTIMILTILDILNSHRTTVIRAGSRTGFDPLRVSAVS